MQETLVEQAPRRRRLFFEAVSGTTQDFTTGSLSRGIALLAIPTMLEMFMESTFGIVDALWVARLGSNAMAAVALTEALIVLLFSVAAGLGMGATATVARRIGEKDAEGAARAAVQVIALGLAVSLITGICGAFFGPRLLGLMSAEPDVIRTGNAYSRLMLGSNGCIMLLFLINGIFRGAGDSAIAMRTLWLANLINLALDPCLIYGLGPFPKLGVLGAAVATTTGRSIGVLYQLSILLGGRGRVAVARRHIRVDWPLLRRVARLSSTAMFQYFIALASWAGLSRINASFGSAAVAGYGLAVRILMFTILPSWGISSAAATLVGQNLGAGKPERSERAVWLAGGYNMAFLTSVGIVFFLFARRIVGLFTYDPAVAPVAVTTLQYVSLGYPCYAWGMVMEQSFNGAGDAKTPTRINLFCYWMFQIPLALFLAFRAGFGPRGVYLAICLAETAMAIIAITLFRRGKWKVVHV